MEQSSSVSRHKLDWEFLVLTPVLFVLLLINIRGLYDVWSSGGADTVELIQQALTTCFYMLVVVLLLVRRRARRTSGSWFGHAAAYVGTFLPFALILNRGQSVDGPVGNGTSVALMLVGMVFSIYALAFLGRSFGVVPAARQLVRHGPYGVVRHPLYAGEIVAFAGVVLGQLTWFALVVLVVLVSVQVYRALQEEKVLEHVFPEYEEYRRETTRFIPGLV